MSRLLGIDIRSTHVRVAELEVSYRKTSIEALYEVDRAVLPDLTEALRAAAGPFIERADAIGVAIDGDKSFVHTIELPPTAQRQLEEVLPFELEAQVPVDIEDLIYDHRALPKAPDTEQLRVLTVAARSEHVKELIQTCRTAIGKEPDRVSSGPLPLANLCNVCSDLAGPGPIALIDLGGHSTEIVFLSHGQIVLSRTLSRGVSGLPETAPALAAELRQTLARWAASDGSVIQAAYLVGGGAAARGAEEYLAYELGVSVLPLPRLHFDRLTDDQLELLPRFGKALGLALGVGGRPRDLDLRRGDLTLQRDYGFLKEKVPLLSGLAAAIVISFFFSAWAESVALKREAEQLSQELAARTNEVFGEQIDDPEEVLSRLEIAKKAVAEDPMPHMDAFDVINAISEAIPPDVTHDIEEFDMVRGQVKLRGIVSSTEEAQEILNTLKEHRCFEGAKIGKITQVVNSTRQKYALEFEVACPEDDKGKAKKQKKKAEGGAP